MVASPLPETAETLTNWLTLHHAPGVGATCFRNLLETFPEPADVLLAGSSQLQALGLTSRTIEALHHPDQDGLARDLAWLAEPDNRILTCRNPEYPALLLEIPDPPPLLYVHGNTEVLGLPQLAMVGSRNPTPAGTRTATEFAQYLSAAGLVITSGLALGIDAASHQGALSANGPTVAVMGTGLDRVYPAGHRDLARRIAANGALVSEFPVGTGPRPENFPRRNRILSGLSLGTLVVEAAPRSGSLISARCAGEQGREVFAIPGSIHNPLARGCHALIKQGAKLVETAQDVIDELGALAAACTRANRAVAPEPAPEEFERLAPEYQQLLDYIGFEPTSIDRLVNTSRLTPAEVSSMLLLLEMNGYIASSPGGNYNRLK